MALIYPDRELFNTMHIINVQDLKNTASYRTYKATLNGVDVFIEKFINQADGTNLYQQHFERILPEANNAHLVANLAIFFNPPRTALYVVWQFFSGGSLLTRLSNPRIGNRRIKQLFREIFAGVHHLHQNNIAHRRLSLKNVPISENGTAVVSKLTFARLVTHPNATISSLANPLHRHPTRPVNFLQLPPELMFHEIDRIDIIYDPFKMDIWCLGLMLFQATNEHLPFGNSAPVTAAEVDNLRGRQHYRAYSIQGELPDELKHLLYDMLQPNPALRPTMDQIVNGRWLNDD